METVRLGNIFGYTGGNFSGNVYDKFSLSPTLNTMQGGNKQPMIVENPNPKLVGGLGEINFGKQYRQGNRVYDSNSVAMCLTAQPLGNTGGNSYLYLTKDPIALDEQNKSFRKDGCVGTLTTDGSSPKHNNRVVEPSLRIRKLTPRECYRLMGFSDEAFDRAEQTNSNAQLYKQAGNSIVVDVLTAIFDNLLIHSRSVWLDELLKDEEV